MNKTKDKIILVDNNISILKYFELLYKGGPYEILTFNNPMKALKRLKKSVAAVVISDQYMPEIEGAIFLEKVREILPDTVRIIMTGFLENKAAIAAINKGNVFHFIRKPIDVQELNLTIRNENGVRLN